MTQKKRGRSLTSAERDLWSRTMSQVRPTGRKDTNEGPYLDDQSWEDVVDEVESLSPSAAGSPGAPAMSPAHRQPSLTHQNLAAPPARDLPRLEVGKNGGTDRRTADRLRRGRMAIDMRLDLHGLTLDLAHRRLLGFLTAAQSSGARCVLVITGKGGRNKDGAVNGIGRLKGAVPRWLNEPAFRPLVLSVTDARPKDGGTGALYVLLRKPRSADW